MQKADAVIVEKVKDVICKQLAVDTKDVVPDSKIADLGADSLDTVSAAVDMIESRGIYALKWLSQSSGLVEREHSGSLHFFLSRVVGV